MNKIKKIDVMPSGLVFLWEDESDTFVEFQKLRDLCPCAYCAGETDVFGNVYIGDGIKKSKLAYEINKIEMVAIMQFKFSGKIIIAVAYIHLNY